MLRTIFASLLIAAAAHAQTDGRGVTPFLSQTILTADVAADQIRHHLIGKVPPLPDPARWKADSAGMRERFLKEIVFHGWPREWVEAPARFEDLGLVPIRDTGYRVRKLRYEIVPGFWSTALLYEPDKLQGRVPAIVNVNGHVGAPGKSVEYKQKRCIQQARMGILALNLEWIAMGELSHRENAHWNAAHLDLAGANGVGLFYLAMRKGLDYLYSHPNADRARLGVTGLSGGGWQTSVLSALDERVALAIPVAGYSAMRARIERTADTGDYEQNATDMATIADFPQLTALRAPRPTLLVYNAEDSCCFRGPLVKPDIFDAIRPIFRLYGAEDAFDWHLNSDPSDHNYQLDNRMAAYRFIARHFRLKAPEKEEPAELLSYEESSVGLPKDNLTVLGVARKLAERRDEGGDLKETIRYHPAEVRRVWAVNNSRSKGLETTSHRFDFTDGLSATAVWLRALDARPDARVTIVLDDRGKAAAGAEVSDRVNRGENVFGVDLLFFGDAAPQKPGPSHYAQMFTALGERPLGIQAAQLIRVAEWARKVTGAREVRVSTSGIRTHLVAVTAATVEPKAFATLTVRDGLDSLKRLFDRPVSYADAPEAFCLDLYKRFDIPALERMAGTAGR